MSYSESQSLDALLNFRDKKNQAAIKVLLERCAVHVITVENSGQLDDRFSDYHTKGNRRVIYISDYIDSSIVGIGKKFPILIENILIVDPTNQHEVAEQTELAAFNHILSNPTGGLPINQILITL